MDLLIIGAIKCVIHVSAEFLKDCRYILKFLDDLVNLASCANEMRSVMYVGAKPCNALYTLVRILKAICCCIGSQ